MSRKRRTAADEEYLDVRTSAADLGGRIGEHAHEWHQLVHVRSGLAVVRSDAGTWLAPPTWAVWMPAGVRHAIRFAGPSALRVVYLRADGGGSLPGAMAVSPLLRELVERATALGALDRRDPVEAALTTLLLAELTDVGPPPLVVPEPASPPARRAAALLATGMPVAPVATAVGVGRRTLERMFLAETGLPVGRWRQYRLLLRGLEEVAGGATVQDASAAAGYTTPSAYIAAFRAAFGTTPARFLDPAQQPMSRAAR
jgi:AraC-like DNA-binding protein